MSAVADLPALGECQEPTDAEKELRRLAGARSKPLFLESFVGRCLRSLGFAGVRLRVWGCRMRVQINRQGRGNSGSVGSSG